MTDELCVLCNQPIRPPEMPFAENQQEHPGVLGLIHKTCYYKQVDKEPAAPWTDPISGEVDFETMAQDLGVSDGSEDQEDGFY